MEIISLEQAREKGLARYFTGKPCKRGHLAKRFTINRSCCDCVSQRRKLYRDANPELFSARFRSWREKNLEKARENYRLWRAKNLEYAKERSRERIAKMRKENPDQIRLYSRKASAKRRSAPGSHNAKDVAEIYKMQRGRCGYCRVKVGDNYHVDHIVPVARGGCNDRSNLQILCATCNCTKHARDPIAFAQSLGRLI